MTGFPRFCSMKDLRCGWNEQIVRSAQIDE